MRATLVAIALVAGCGRDRPEEVAAASAPPEPPLAHVDATDLIERFQCNRCHELAGVAAAPRDKHCVACHQEIHAGTFPADADTLARWRSRITSLRFAPSLAGADRLRRPWIRDFLLAPHDVRPGLVAQMPRLAIAPVEAERLAAHLSTTASEDARTAANELSRGEQLYRALACGRCHRFTGASVDDPALHARGEAQVDPQSGSWQLAPDLRHARARLTVTSSAAWIEKPRGAMPALGVSAGDARALAVFIARVPLAATEARTPPPRLPVLDREVTWETVEARVFKDVCWHCHAVPDFARGDGGPGNSGGFGLPPRGLDLSSYSGIAAGSLDDDGERRSAFAKLPDGTPRLVAHLYARHVEAAGGRVEGIRGMPLGLPPLPLEDIQLVETWIAQGRPR